MKLKFSLAVLVVFLSLRLTHARTWVDKTDTFKIEAELVTLEGEVVHLKKADGTIIKVPLNKLCWDDRKFVRQQMAARAAEAREANSDNVVTQPDSDDANVVVKPDSAHVVGKPDSEASPATSQPASTQDAPARATTGPALEKQQQGKLVATKQRKLEQLQKELERLQNAPAPRGRSSAQQQNVRAKRLEELQSQIAKLQEEIESADGNPLGANAATGAGPKFHSGAALQVPMTVADVQIPHLNRYTPVPTARETDAYPLMIKLMLDDAYDILHTPVNVRGPETRRLLKVAIRANIPDKQLVLLLRKGIESGKSKDVDAFTSARVVRESLEFITACGYRGPLGDIDENQPRVGGGYDTLRNADELLRFGIIKTDLFNQLAATVRLGKGKGFKESTEAAELFKALKEGRPSYRIKPAILSSVGLEEGRWQQVMMAGSGVTWGDACTALQDTASNAEAARSWPLTALTRTLQWEIDIAPALPTDIANTMTGSGIGLPIRTQDEVAKVFVQLIHESDYSDARDKTGLSAKLEARMKVALAAQHIRLAEKEIPKVISCGLSVVSETATTLGYDSLSSMLVLHNPKYLLAVTSTFDSEKQEPREPQKDQ